MSPSRAFGCSGRPASTLGQPSRRIVPKALGAPGQCRLQKNLPWFHEIMFSWNGVASHNPEPPQTTNKRSMWRKTAMNQYHWLDLQGSRLLLCWVFCLKCHASRKSSDSLPVYAHKQYQRKASKHKACWFGVESPAPFIPELMTLLTFLLALASLSRCSQQNCPFWLHSAHAFLIFATFSFSFSLCALGTLRFPPHVFATLKGFPTVMWWRNVGGDLGCPNHRQCLASENRPPGFPRFFPSLPWVFGSRAPLSLALWPYVPPKSVKVQ